MQRRESLYKATLDKISSNVQFDYSTTLRGWIIDEIINYFFNKNRK